MHVNELVSENLGDKVKVKVKGQGQGQGRQNSSYGHPVSRDKVKDCGTE